MMDLLLRAAERWGWGCLLAVGGSALLLGAPVGLGILAGGALALANFACLARIGRRLLASPGGAGVRAWWWLGSALRHLAVFAALAVLFASGRVHPLAVAAGLTLPPVVLIALALRQAREA